MSDNNKKIDIPYADVDRVRITDNRISHGDLADKRVGPGRPLSEFAYGPDNFWRDKPLGRTLSARNKQGRALWGIAGAAVAMTTGISIDVLTPNQPNPITMDLLTDINIWSVLFGIAAAALGFLKAKSDQELTEVEEAQNAMIEQARLGMVIMSEAKKGSSEAGEKLSPAEKDQVIAQAGKVFESIANYGKVRLFE